MNINEQTQQICQPYIEMAKSAAASVRVAIPGIVTSYNSQNQTVSVQPSVLERVRGEQIRLPILSDVPVFFAGGAGVAIMHSISVGDECLVIFGDVSIDSWWQSSGIQASASTRRHSLSDGFALVGFRSKPNALPANGNVIDIKVKTNDGWVNALSVDSSGTVSGKFSQSASFAENANGDLVITY